MQFERLYLQLCTLAPKVPKARHTERAVGSFFVHKLLKSNILQSNEPCHSSLSAVFRVLRNSFSYPRDACITHSQTVLALNPKNSRALTVLFNGAGWILKLLLPAIIIANGYFKKKIQRCRNHRQRPQIGAEKGCKINSGYSLSGGLLGWCALSF